jgi:small subunit ribosomal protein S2
VCSLRCIQVIAGVLGRAGEKGQQKRLEAAKRGEITWLPPPGLGKPITEEEKAKEATARGERVVKSKVGEDEDGLQSIIKRQKFRPTEEDDDL